MMLLHRLLPVFVMPIGLSLVLLAAGIYFRSRALLVAAGVVLWCNSTPLMSRMLLKFMEQSAKRIPAASVPAADAIVVLSGGRTVTPGPAALYDWREPDRFYGGVELAKAGKAPYLVFTSGAPGDTSSEGSVLVGYARSMGVPVERILTAWPAANTAEESQAVATLLRERLASAGLGRPARIILVTSAFHMARARKLFERAGLAVEPFPVEFQYVPNEKLGVMGVFPSAESLKLSELAWHEMYGRLFYRVFR